MKTSERERKEPPMNAWSTADAVVRRPEAAIPVSERGCGLVDGRGSIVDAPLEDPEAALRVREDAGGWAR